MTRRMHHIPTDRLTALALVARAPQDQPADSADVLALEHLGRCDECSRRFSQMTVDVEGLRDVAFAQADEVFDDAMLDAQRTRILDRLAHLGQSARVISFPARAREVTMPVSPNGRRWISVAAAAGLIIGLVAGQMLHFIPGAAFPVQGDSPSIQASERSGPPSLVPVAASLPMLSDDELMEEVEAAIELRRVRGLRAIDALTPTPADTLASGRD
jgi:hypothetical protein